MVAQCDRQNDDNLSKATLTIQRFVETLVQHIDRRHWAGGAAKSKKSEVSSLRSSSTVSLFPVIYALQLSHMASSSTNVEPGRENPLENSRSCSPSPSTFRKSCDRCRELNDVLVRCQIDTTATWYFICSKKCWKEVSGGVVDGTLDRPHYRYGGTWKNKHAHVTAKKPKRRQKDLVRDWQPSMEQYSVNDKVRFERKVWLCRRTHGTSKDNAPGKNERYWMEIG